MKVYLISLSLLSGCCLGTCKSSPEPEVHQMSVLAYRQPNRDPSFATMVVLADEGDGA